MSDASPPLRPASTPLSPPVGGSGRAGYDLDSLPADAFGSNAGGPVSASVTPMTQEKAAASGPLSAEEDEIQQNEDKTSPKKLIQGTSASVGQQQSPALPAAAAAASMQEDEAPLQRGTYDLSKLDQLDPAAANPSELSGSSKEPAETRPLADRFGDKVSCAVCQALTTPQFVLFPECIYATNSIF